MAPPVFKTGLAGIAFAGRFDSFPPPPNSMSSKVDAKSVVAKQMHDHDVRILIN